MVTATSAMSTRVNHTAGSARTCRSTRILLNGPTCWSNSQNQSRLDEPRPITTGRKITARVTCNSGRFGDTSSASANPKSHQDGRDEDGVARRKSECDPELPILEGGEVVGETDELATAEQGRVGQRQIDELHQRPEHEYADKQQRRRDVEQALRAGLSILQVSRLHSPSRRCGGCPPQQGPGGPYCAAIPFMVSAALAIAPSMSPSKTAVCSMVSHGL